MRQQAESEAYPRLSVVVAARNDDHGGDMLSRMTLFLQSLSEQAAQYKCYTELIVVEWNPPNDRPRLMDAILWPKSHPHLLIRLITVPFELHARIPHSDKIQFYQYIAKNVGIRRARGQYVISTNLDILLSNETFRFVAVGELQEDCFYRIDRCDVKLDLHLQCSIFDIQQNCLNHIQQVFTREGVYSAEELPVFRLWLWENYPLLAKGFALVSFLIGPRREPHWKKRTVTDDSTNPHSYFTCLVVNLRDRAQLLLNAIKHLLFPDMPWLHLGASGDFTLLARKHWWSLHGYPELPTLPIHIDSVICLMAHFHGLHERVLLAPMRLFHIQHAGGWSPDAEWSGELERKERDMGVRAITNDQLVQWAREMRMIDRAIIFNDENWGLGEIQLMESTISN